MPPHATIFAVLLTPALSGTTPAPEPNVARDVPLADFEDPDCLGHVQTDGDVTVELSTEHVHSGRRSLAVRLGEWAEDESEVDKGFPGVRVHMDGPRRDWSFHAILEAWAYIPQPMEHFYFELRDDQRTKCFFNPSQVVGEWFPIQVGLGVFGARLSSVDHAFFYSHKPKAATFYIDDVRLREPRPEWADERQQVLDFVRRYKIMPDNIQRRTPPTIDDLAALKRTGWVGRFNLLQMHGFMATFDDTRRLGEINSNLKLIEAMRPKLEELGLWEKAYVYGFNEAHGEAVWHAMRQAFGAVKECYPDLMTLSTTYGGTYGSASEVDAIDAWCPRTSGFDPKRVREARRRGKQVWWYICIGPRHPYANWFIEYPAIEARLLMGAMTAKYRPDGFLYFAANMWSNGPITSGPYTDWDPSFKSNNGDGRIFSEGPDGLIPTIRVESFRDGMEDYEYYLLLERLGGKARVSSDVVTDLTHFTHDPEALYREWARVAEEIVRFQGAR